MPTPITKPPKESIFKENPNACIKIKASNTETGMELPTMIEAFQSPKKINKTIMERIIPIPNVVNTVLTEAKILSLESNTTSKWMPFPERLICSAVLTAARVTSTVEALCRFVMVKPTFSFPL